MAIEAGTLVEVTTAGGSKVQMRALGAPTQGRDFVVVWVCTEAEWVQAQSESIEPSGLPWPVEAVEELAPA